MVFKVMGLDEITKEVNTHRKSTRKKPWNTMVKKSGKCGGTSGDSLQSDH